MGKEHALFDEDFDFDLDEDEDFASAGGDLPEPVSATLDAFDADTDEAEALAAPQLEAPQKHVIFEDVDLEVTPGSGGDRPIPAISVMAFLEQPETIELMRVVAGDRRMAQANVKVSDGGLESAIGYLSSNVSPNLLIVESAAPASEMIGQIDRLAEYCDEGVEVMVIGATNDIKLYRQLMARGVSEYVVPPVKPLQVVRSIGELFTNPDAPFIGKSVAVVGAKGGVGASTIAHNLAWALSENAGFNTVLVDLDVSFGTTALDFNHDNQQTVTDALLDPDRVDQSVISRLLAKATDRLSLFTAPASVDEMPEIAPEAYGKVIETVRGLMPWVVLDLPHVWSAWTQRTLMDADEVVLVCQPDLASLRNGKNMIDRLQAERPNDAPPRLVINMTGVPKRPEIPIKDFVAAIGMEPAIILPFDPQLFGTASNNGQMISETDPAAKPSIAIDHLASLLTGQAVEQRQKTLLQKLMGR